MDKVLSFQGHVWRTNQGCIFGDKVVEVLAPLSLFVEFMSGLCVSCVSEVNQPLRNLTSARREVLSLGAAKATCSPKITVLMKEPRPAQSVSRTTASRLVSRSRVVFTFVVSISLRQFNKITKKNKDLVRIFLLLLKPAFFFPRRMWLTSSSASVFDIFYSYKRVQM